MNSIDPTVLAGLPPATKSGATPTPAGKLRDAAAQFESMLIAQMLKSMRESSDGSLDGDSGASSTYTEMAEQQFAQAMTAQGGMGIAKMVETQLGNQDAH